MTIEQLKRIDNINFFAKYYYPVIKPIDCGRFAVLDERERENILEFWEKKVQEVRKQRIKVLNN